MVRTKRVLELAIVVVLLCGLAGCPLFSPVLDVNPLAVHFNPTDEIRSFRIENVGAGTLNWEATSDDAGVYLNVRTVDAGEAKQGESSVTGTLTDRIAIVEIAIDRNLLPEKGAQVEVTSNGGTATVLITASRSIEGEATFNLNVDSLDFGISQEQNIITITNTGSVPLTWNVASKPTWVTLVPSSGTVEPGNTIQVVVRVNRDGLIPGDYTGTITFTTNAGPASLDVSMTVPPFFASPNTVDFGVISQEAVEDLFIISNSPECGTCPPTNIDIISSTTDNVAWFTTDVTNVNLNAATSLQVSVSAFPALVTPGEHTGQIILRDTATGFEYTVQVQMERSSILVSPVLIDFGNVFDETSATFTISNIGSTIQSYTVTPPVSEQDWLDVTAPADDATPNSVAPGTGPSSSDVYTVTVNPDNVVAGTYVGNIEVTFPGGVQTVRVRMVAQKNPDLVVTPQVIDFSSTRTQESIGIINVGTTGVINWTIDTTNFPAWLSLRPVNNLGEASGVLNGGGAAQSVILTADRSQIPPNQGSATFTFDVVGTGDVNETEQVRVSVSNPLLPRIVVIGDSTNLDGVETVTITESENSHTFIIRNEGFGNLEWSIIGAINIADPNVLLPVPPWITGISPSQDTLAPGLQQNVTIQVSRETLNYLGANIQLVLETNDPNASLDPDSPNNVGLIVNIIVPKVAVIGVKPGELAFGENTVSAFFEVANVGDPDTRLSYRISSNENWISFFPEEGASVGTVSPLKDWQLHSVSVDRSLLNSAGGAATLTIEALLNSEIDPSILPATISITVQVPKLTIESPKAKQKVPSLVRHNMTLRNLRNGVIKLDDNHMPAFLDGISIFENNVQVEVSEDQKFTKLATPERVSTNVIIMLDYSGSMQQSASEVDDVTISGAPDPLQALYERTISQLIAEMPDDYKVGLVVFNERSAFVTSLRTITTSSAETPNTAGQLFIKDKNVLLQRLDDVVVLDNGATELVPALLEASILFYDEDFYDNLFFPFDEADVRALICVTDGRLTTPPASIGPVGILMEELRIKFLPVGWGSQISVDPLIQLATTSGGHLYSSPTVPTGLIDPETDLPIRKPSAVSLENWCVTDPADSCDQSIAADLQNQILLSYVTLNEASSSSIRVNVEMNDPTDTDISNLTPEEAAAVCMQEQGTISNEVNYTNYPMFANSGDVNLGQIFMQTDGVINNEAVVYVNLDSAPRNIRNLGFNISLNGINGPDPAINNLVLDYEVVLENDGGLIYDWNVLGSMLPSLSFQSADGAPLLMGEFGRLLKLTITRANNLIPMPDFRVDLNVNSPVYSTGAINEKYFTYPDSIVVAQNTPYKATSFPRLFFDNFNPAPSAVEPYEINLGSTIPFASFDVSNRGGSHSQTGVWLDMLFTVSTSFDPAFVSSTNSILFPTSPTATLLSTYTRDDMFIFPLRCGTPGNYTAQINPLFTYGSIHTGVGFPLNNFAASPIYVHYSVASQLLSVIPAQNNIVLGPGQNSFNYTVSNAGQSTLSWVLNTNGFPDWLFASPAAGTLSACTVNSQQLTLGIDRSQLPVVLPVTHNFTISSNGGSFSGSITVRPSALVINPSISNINLISPNDTFPLTLTNIDPNVTVNWSVLNAATLPAWLSFSQTAGTLNPDGQSGDEVIVNLQIDNLSLPPLPVSANFQFTGDGELFTGTVTVN